MHQLGGKVTLIMRGSVAELDGERTVDPASPHRAVTYQRERVYRRHSHLIYLIILYMLRLTA
ncbi:hypothetical protein SKAU_G00179420 [Synaphobranchus kaupii]|uniref:Uncharacterized protein n=1 Tax=Synaphobranchus kaupii TaxID=118154 RepID=A0A9Q1FLV7_SYNKA|nr:hypothetical protein SKAU_G00179420 [Synaphobranchus kaupii]